VSVGEPKDGGGAGLRRDSPQWTVGGSQASCEPLPRKTSQFAIKPGQWERVLHEFGRQRGSGTGRESWCSVLMQRLMACHSSLVSSGEIA